MAKLTKREKEERLGVLVAALKSVAAMKHPSVADLLRAKGYGYEATKVEELVKTFECWRTTQ